MNRILILNEINESRLIEISNPNNPTQRFAISVENFLESTTPYKVYTALLSQSGKGNAPTAKILENTIGNIVWIATSPGVYRATLVGAFPNLDKFFTLNYKSMVEAQKFIAVEWKNSNSFEVSTSVVGYSPSIAYTPEDSLLSNYPIEIRIYN
jgi:hypothetical protein